MCAVILLAGIFYSLCLTCGNCCAVCNYLGFFQSIIQASVRNMAEGGASGPPDLISGMVQPVDLVNSVTR